MRFSFKQHPPPPTAYKQVRRFVCIIVIGLKIGTCRYFRTNLYIYMSCCGSTSWGVWGYRIPYKYIICTYTWVKSAQRLSYDSKGPMMMVLEPKNLILILDSLPFTYRQRELYQLGFHDENTIYAQWPCLPNTKY